MPRHIELGHNANAAVGSVGNQIFDFSLGVIVSVGSHLVQLGQLFALTRKP